AHTEWTRWASDGSVELELRFALADLVTPAPAAMPDGGVAAAAPAAQPVVLVDHDAQPTWFREESGTCVAAPRYFRSALDARAAGGELKDAPLVRSREALAKLQRETQGPPPRVVAVVWADDTGGAPANTGGSGAAK